MVSADLLELLACPSCRGSLHATEDLLVCASCQQAYPVVDDIPVFLSDPSSMSEDIRVSADKWNQFWRTLNWELAVEAYNVNLQPIYRYLPALSSGQSFLEVGGGPSFLSFDLAGKGPKVVSVDLDLMVLRVARRHFAAHGRDGHFVCADITVLPFKDGVFHLCSGIGVLEHTRRIEKSIVELARVLRTGGTTFQTVPLLSLTTLFTSSLRFGTIPRLPLLAPLVKTVHMRWLKMRRMKYGYEECFTYRFLRRAFRSAGFEDVELGFYDYGQTLFKRSKRLGPFFYRLMRLRMFGLTPFADIAYIKARR